MSFCISSASRYANCLVFRFFPPLALWCTFQEVESREIFSKSASIERAWNTVPNTPMSRHFWKRLCTVCHGPYRSGSSLHGAPPLAIHSIPFSAVRLSHFAGYPRFPSLGCSGGSRSLMRFHSLSISSYRFVSIWLVYRIVFDCSTFIFQTNPSRFYRRTRKSKIFGAAIALRAMSAERLIKSASPNCTAYAHFYLLHFIIPNHKKEKNSTKCGT